MASTSSEIGHDDIETVVIDSVGHLRIPLEIRQRLGIGQRATVEIIDGVIQIKPVTSSETPPKS
jgi:bifunctional DNA-binding transcriptional regulator/antitoxin component of YhaV-PrlF toxin-antitoxin module